ncbi:MAG: hypothetical protein ACI4W1_01000 [Ruminococcus sp.]
MKSKFTRKISVAALCIVMLILSVMPAYAAENNDTTYVENHSVIHCSNYYIDGSTYRFQIKVAKGTPLSAVTIKDAYMGTLDNMSDIPATDNIYNCKRLEYQYSDSTTDVYLYTYDTSHYGAPRYSWYYYGIKLLYDYNGNHYMATNTSIGSTVEGDGYRLVR